MHCICHTELNCSYKGLLMVCSICEEIPIAFNYLGSMSLLNLIDTLLKLHISSWNKSTLTTSKTRCRMVNQLNTKGHAPPYMELFRRFHLSLFKRLFSWQPNVFDQRFFWISRDMYAHCIANNLVQHQVLAKIQRLETKYGKLILSSFTQTFCLASKPSVALENITKPPPGNCFANRNELRLGHWFSLFAEIPPWPRIVWKPNKVTFTIVFIVFTNILY